jgi:hypothetical protein
MSSFFSLENIINSLGVILMLSAYFLLSIKKIKAESIAYNLLNLTGGTLACVGSYMIGALPFVLLEGVWACVAAFSLYRNRG